MKMNTYRRLFWINTILFWAMFAGLHAQSPNFDSIEKRFRAVRERTLEEKLYLHIDREFYLTGETMWLRIYQVDGAFHKPVNLSKVAYVEILNRDNESVVQAKIELGENGGEGALFIPATLSSDTYLIRAYTNWMKNFSTDFFFEKTVSIVNPFLRPEPPAAKKTAPVAVEFFPEGGHLVSGLRSKVAFRISGAQSGVSYTGTILNQNDDTVTVFTPLAFGIGHFYFTPRPADRYRCVISATDDARSVHSLPEVRDRGFVMHLDDTETGTVTVEVNTNGVEPGFVYMFVHSRRVTVHAVGKHLEQGRTRFEIPQAKLPEGVSHFTLFNGDLLPVCERLFFTRPASPLTLSLTTDQSEFLPRRKVSVDIRAMTGTLPVTATASVSVYRVDSLGSETGSGIQPWLLLTSDLNGTVESPEFYLSDSPSAKEAADNLMLTHGWRRFNWDDVLGDPKPFRFVPEMRTHLIFADVITADGQPAHGVPALMASPSKIVGLNASRSDKDGGLIFEIPDFYGPRKLVLQTASTDSTLRVSVRDPYSKQPARTSLPPLKLSPDMREQLEQRSLAMQIQDIYHREVSEKRSGAVKDSTAFYGAPDQTFLLDNYTRFPVMEEVMREYVPGVMVRKRQGKFHFVVIDAVQKGVLEGDPLVLLDGVPVFEVDRIMKFDPLKVRKLDVVMRNYILGPVRMTGIVSYTTYSGDLAGFELDPRAVTLNYEGLQVRREFWSPAYETAKMRGTRMPDQRTLLHWNPTVDLTDDSTTLEFYTSDVPGTYKIVVEALTKDGQGGTGSHTFQVKRMEF